MKRFLTFFGCQSSCSRFCLLAGIAVFIMMAMPVSGISGLSSSTKAREAILRSMSANKQLKEYHQLQKSSSVKNHGVSVSVNPTMKSSSNVFYYDNMESGTNGWTTGVLDGGTGDIWHQTTSNSSSASHSWWAGVDGQGDYNTGNRINAVLVSPTIDLSTAVEPISLLYTESYMTEQGWDFCMVEISNDNGASWIPLNGLYGHSPNGDSRGWKITTISLNAFAGGIVKLRFHFDTGDAAHNNFPGWFVDDVMIFDKVGTVTGKTFFDVNNNGAKDEGERGLQNHIITATGPITLSMQTNDWGNFSMPLPLGSYTVSEVLQPGWNVTMPVGGTYNIAMTTPDTTVNDLLFGDYKQGVTLTGTIYNVMYADSFLSNWRVNLYNNNGDLVDFARSDSMGQFTMYVFETGNYTVEPVEKLNWDIIDPDTGLYQISVTDLNTNFSMLDFGYNYDLTTNTIIGRVYGDLNMNGTLNEHEPLLSGWKVHLFGQAVANRYRITDDSGYYAFLNLSGCRQYQVEEIHQAGYCQSEPLTNYVAYLCNGQTLDSANFGNFVTTAGSVSGTVFFDRNGNALIDSNEAGLAGFTVNLSGTANGAAINLSTLTDSSGAFAFTGLWSGTYTVSEVGRLGWWQTSPADLGNYSFTLGCAETKGGYLFGNLDSLYLGSFRTFTAESLALAKDVKGKFLPVDGKPIGDQFTLKFKSTQTDSVGKLTVLFKQLVTLGSITSSRPATIELLKKNLLVLTFTSYLQPGDSVVISGYSPSPKLEVVNTWFWSFANGKKSAVYHFSTFTKNVLKLPMPNAWNGVQLIGAGVRVGLGGAHSVVTAKYTDVIQSLVERGGRMHIGAPACLYMNSKNKLITKQLKALTPTLGQNKLFAKALALKVNILESQANITPPGFGGLIYDDGTGASNPFNNLSVYQIAAKLDSFMTQATPCVMLPSLYPLSVNQLDSLIGVINASFSGPMDTIRYGGGLRYKPTKMLSEVPFFRYDTSTTARQEWIEMPLYSETPVQFEVYQNYPNPFNPTTQLSFVLGHSSLVTLTVYNVLGQEVVSLLQNEFMGEGIQEVEFNATNLPSGVYFYRVSATGVDDNVTFTDVKRMTLIK